MTHPNYPRFYRNDLDSTQTIEVAEGKTIRFSWTDFDIEQCMEQCYDNVRILDSYGTNLTPKLFGRERISWVTRDGIYARLGKNYSTDSNSLAVEFITDSSMRGRGWKLKWTEQ